MTGTGLFADAVRRMRSERGLSQRALAWLLRWNSSHISLVESGRRDISVLRFMKLADKLGFDVDLRVRQRSGR